MQSRIFDIVSKGFKRSSKHRWARGSGLSPSVSAVFRLSTTVATVVARKTGRKRRRRAREKRKKERKEERKYRNGGKGGEIWRTNWPVALDGHSWIQIFIATWPECSVKAAKCSGGGRSLIKRKIRGVSCISLLRAECTGVRFLPFELIRLPSSNGSLPSIDRFLFPSLDTKHCYFSVAKIFVSTIYKIPFFLLSPINQG